MAVKNKRLWIPEVPTAANKESGMYEFLTSVRSALVRMEGGTSSQSSSGSSTIINYLPGTDVDTSEFVHNKGVLSMPSQLPSNPVSGDFYYVEGVESFYVFIGGAWRIVASLSQANTVDALPADSAALAVLTASLNDGAHLTVIN